MTKAELRLKDVAQALTITDSSVPYVDTVLMSVDEIHFPTSEQRSTGQLLHVASWRPPAGQRHGASESAAERPQLGEDALEVVLKWP